MAESKAGGRAGGDAEAGNSIARRFVPAGCEGDQ